MCKILTLTTDFGNSFFVGVMKGVILSISDKIRIVDIAHNINKFSILEGMYVLSNSYSWFPEKSVHIAVIDPGVGSERKSIVVETSKYYFVGPDNGIFSFLDKNDIVNIYEITYKNNKISNTFHGRDIFAPIGAKITLNKDCLNELCQNIKFSETYTFNMANMAKNKFQRKVVYIDDFGNIILDLKKGDIDESKKWILSYKNFTFKNVNYCYSDVKVGELLLLINSFGNYEIAMRQGNAAAKLNAKIGDEYSIRFD